MKNLEFTINNQKYELMVLMISGSKLYGNSTPESDIDYRGIFKAHNCTKLGLLNKVEKLDSSLLIPALREAGLELEDTDDIMLHEVNKFTEMCLDNNPNILDLLCHDFMSDNNLFISDMGQLFLQSRNLFLSKKIKFTFSGYAIAQLKKIKSRDKWINNYPDAKKILNLLSEQHDIQNIDFNWICDNFGGQVAEKITGETPRKNTSISSLITWDAFNTLACSTIAGLKDIPLESYRMPRIIHYCTIKDLSAKTSTITPFLEDFLNNKASFRTISPSMLIVYDQGKGLFSKEGKLKVNDPEKIGEFKFMLSINYLQHKHDKDNITKMWHWRCNRNEKRSVLEEQVGYDTKNASHLFRLLLSCKDVLQTGVYHPELKAETLQLVKDVRAGKYTYGCILEESTKLDNELSELYKTSALQPKPNIKAANDLLLLILGADCE